MHDNFFFYTFLDSAGCEYLIAATNEASARTGLPPDAKLISERQVVSYMIEFKRPEPELTNPGL